MFNLDGMFSMLFAVTAFIVGLVFLILKLCGLLLLPWGWVLAPFVLCAVLVLLAGSKVG